MPPSAVLLSTESLLLPELFYRGKVRDTFDLGDALLMVATDRISAFDVVLPNGIPDKGKVLNLLSQFWFEQVTDLVSHHVIDVVDSPDSLEYCNDSTGVCYMFPPDLIGRAMVVKKAKRVDIECVARGYISGSAWAEYRSDGTVAGITLPKGLIESQELPEVLFTPATKADTGHDENITFEQMAAMVGRDVAEELRRLTIAVYQRAAGYARGRGIIIADTKMEFGFIDGELRLIDELLTPDSSRFWDMQTYQPGRSQPSFDKQFVRDWLNSVGWNHEPPAPELPPDIVEATAEKYRQAYQRLVGRPLR